MEKFSVGVLLSWKLAGVETLQAGYGEITPEFLLCGLMKIEECLSPDALGNLRISENLQKEFQGEAAAFLSALSHLGVQPGEIRHRMRELIGPGQARDHQAGEVIVHRTESTKSVFASAFDSSLKQGRPFIALPDLLYALLACENENILAVMHRSGVDVNRLKSELIGPPSLSVIAETLPPEVEDIPELVLSVKLPGQEAREHKLRRREIIIGRQGMGAVDIDLSADHAVSRRHARLFYRDGGWYVEDLQSRYGTILNGERILAARPVTAENQMRMGNTLLSLCLEPDDPLATVAPSLEEELTITNEQWIDEVGPPGAFSEDDRIRILAEFMERAAHARTEDGLHEICIRMIFDAIPGVERATILIDRDGELAPVKFHPGKRSYYSETYARQTRKKREAISWLRKQADGIPDSMLEVAAAMYAPMVRNGSVKGVLHADSTTLAEGFTKSALDTLSVIANVLALSLPAAAGEHSTPSVFISYAHRNAERANRLKGDLRRNGISVWIDERLKAGDEPWKKQLKAAIQGQPCFLYLMTPDSLASKYCDWELRTARRLRKRIIPLLMEETDLPPAMARLQFIDFRRDYSAGLDALIETLFRAS